MGKVLELWLTCTGILLLLSVPAVMGWGYEGHFTVCKIAQWFLTDKAQTGVKALLPDYADGELAAVCSWADEFRDLMPWSAELHYVNQPDFSCNYNYSRDCHNSAGVKGRCVTGAIFNYTEQLRLGVQNLNSEMKYNLTEALMFLSHFIGDVHQPLHAGFLGDKGGNRIYVRWYENQTNLHRVWDSSIIETYLEAVYDSDLSLFAQTLLVDVLGSTDRSTWGECAADHLVCPDMYALESSELACDFAYKDVTPGATLGDDYFLSRWPVVETRLLHAAVRLADTLNQIFNSTPSTSQD